MRRPSLRALVTGTWLVWCGWWFADGACTFVSACANLLMPIHIGERTVSDVLVLMLSGFPTGTYAAGFLGDYVVGSDKPLNGFVGYVVLALGTVAAGYLQWFILLPHLWRWWNKRRSAADRPAINA